MTLVDDKGYTYKHIGPRYGSAYRQFFVNDRRIRAEILYREVLGVNHMTPGEVAEQYDVSLDAVLECLHYCETHAEVLQADRDAEEASIREHGLDRTEPQFAAAGSDAADRFVVVEPLPAKSEG